MLAVAVVVWASAAQAADPEAAPPQEPVVLRAGKADSAYHGLALELAAALNQPENGAPKISVEESQGSVQNVIDAIHDQQRALFTSPPNVIFEARRGDKPYGKDPAYREIRALFPIPFQAMHWVVRQDSGVQGFADLATRPFIPGANGTFAERQTAALLKILGLDNQVQLIDIDSSAAPAALKSKQVIGFATAGPYPIASLASLAGEVPISLLTLTPEQLSQELASDGTTVPLTIPAGTYPGVDRDTVTVALPAGIFTTTHLSDALAYRITKAFWTARPRLAENAHAWAAVTEDGLKVLGTKLHAGALQYYREAGVTVPEGLK
jgi:TRAP transporter TAXI family solute receptor